MKKLGKIALLILLSPLILVLLSIALPIIAYCSVRDAVSLRLFQRREDGNFYLVCTPRRGWHDYVRNNVVPILPPNVCVVWYRPSRGLVPPPIISHVEHSKILGLSKPYLVRVGRSKIRAESLNLDLQEMKRHPATDNRVRIQSASVIQKKMSNL